MAELHPALKKSNADHEQYSNFRPISNLPLVFKVIEKAIADQSIQHVQNHDLHEAFFQSAYKTCRSTETALIRVQNDLCAIDNRSSVIWLLLDLSAAFDTWEHSTTGSLGFRLILVLKGMLWLGSGLTLLRVSNTFVLRVVSPLLEAWIKVCHKGPY